MRSEQQTVDPEVVAQAQRRVRRLVSEIAEHAQSKLAPLEFYTEFLQRVVSALAAVGGAVWVREPDGTLGLQYDINLRDTGLLDSEEKQVTHGKLLGRTLTTGQPALVRPRADGAPGVPEANPTDYLLVLAPLKSEDTVIGVVEIFQRPVETPNTQRGYLRFLSQMCELAGTYLQGHQLRQLGDRQALWERLDVFTRMVHGSLDTNETAYTIANEGRRLIGCDRVSIAIKKGGRYVVKAVSGQETFDPRSTTIALLNELATAVVATGESVWYTGDKNDMAPQVETTLDAYLDESHSKTVAVLPLVRAPREESAPRPEPVGALIVEQIEDARLAEGLLERVEVVREHSTCALANSLEHQGLFLMPVWKTLGKTRFMVQAKTLPKTISVGVALLVLALALAFIPSDLELKAEGSLQPIQRRDIFAKVDGQVMEVTVKHGDLVKQGQVLATLQSTEIQAALESLQGERNGTQERLVAVREALIRSRKRGSAEMRGTSAAELAQLHGQRKELEQTLKSIDRQIELQLTKIDDLTVRSPIAGQVVSWDIADMLLRRPVKRGEVLMRVVDPTADWELELMMPEDRMGHVRLAEKEAGKPLEVTYVLATAPGQKREGTVKEIERAAEVRGEEGNTVLVKVAINKDELGNPLPGALAHGKVNCGSRSLGYVLFHDVVAFIQSRVIFPLM